MHFICRSFIGKNNPQWWSQSWENEPDDQIKFTKGHLFGLVNLQTDKNLDLKIIGHDLISEINQVYFSQKSEDIGQNIKETLNSISQNPIFADYQINIAILIVINQQIFSGIIGEGKVILQRGSQISQILSGSSDQVSLISGPIKDNDRILLSSQSFFDQISWEKIKTILVEPKIQNIEENFLSLLYSFDNQDFLSSVLVETHQDSDSTTIDSTAPEISADSSPLSSPPPSPPVFDTPTSVPPAPASLNQPSPIYVKHRVNFKIGSHKKIQIAIAIFLLIGLIVSSFFGYKKNQSAKTESSFQNLKVELEKKLNNISVVKSLNLEAAYQSAKEAQEIIQSMSQLGVHSDEISQYKSQVDSVLSQTGDSDTFTPDSIYDTSLITSNPKFSKIFFSKSALYLLDSVNGRIDSFLPQEKSTKNISISDQIKSGEKILVDNNNIYLFSQNQIKLVEKNSLTTKLDLNSQPSITVTDIQFWNGSVYVIDKPAQSVWKFTPSSSGFSSPQSWLKNNAKLELGASSLAIDSRIWVLTESGQINLYLSGVKDNFKQNQSLSFTKTTSLNTDEKSDFLVFLDDSKFIYVYKKTGEFSSKFNLSNFQVLDIAFDSTNKTIYFLASDQKIYRITL